MDFTTFERRIKAAETQLQQLASYQGDSFPKGFSLQDPNPRIREALIRCSTRQFLKNGGKIQHVPSSLNAGANGHAKLTRQQNLDRLKRYDTLAITARHAQKQSQRAGGAA